MLTTALGIIAPLLSLVGSIVGDYFLSKWITAFRVWWRTKAWDSLQKLSNDQYNSLAADFDQMAQDRPDYKPPTISPEEPAPVGSTLPPAAGH